MPDTSVNITALVAELTADLAAAETDTKAFLPLAQKAITLLKAIEPLDPAIAPVVTVVSDVLSVAATVLANV